MTIYAKHTRDELIEEIEEYRALCDKLSSILTRTANALKGEPEPRHRHSWHDLPEVALNIKKENGDLASAAVLPDGWKLVPTDPNDEWLDNLYESGLRIGSFGSAIRDVIAASPEYRP